MILTKLVSEMTSALFYDRLFSEKVITDQRRLVQSLPNSQKYITKVNFASKVCEGTESLKIRDGIQMDAACSLM